MIRKSMLMMPGKMILMTEMRRTITGRIIDSERINTIVNI